MAAQQVQLQQRQHIRRLIGVRIHPSGFVGAGVQAVGLHPAQRVGGVHRIQQRPQGGGVGGEVLFRRNAGVVQIAAAVAGGEKFLAKLRVALQHRDAGSGGGFGGGKGCGQPGGSAAQDQDLLQEKHQPFKGKILLL